MRKILVAATMMAALVSIPTQAAEYEAGKHYRVLDKPLNIILQDGKKVAVWEYFSYQCGYCFTFERPVIQWASQQDSAVQFEQVPAIFNSSMEPGAQTYYALQLMKADDDHRVSWGVYDEIHLRKAPAKTLSNYAKLVSRYGVSEEDFMKMANSFAVNVKVNQAKSATFGARLEGTPSMLVDGQYLVMSNKLVPSHEDVLKVVDFLVEQELAK